ncbi:MAG: glycosyltransferase [Candidatus Nanoarchaeia archaeon]
MRIAVLIPAYNEEKTIAKVVKDFRKELPKADILVFDNNSRDKTAKLARKAGAKVVKAEKQGKGNVVQKMFSEVDADVYVMVDADDTYPAEYVHKLIKPIVKNEADMTVGMRMNGFVKEEKALLHKIGNKLILWSLNLCFPTKIKDMLSGYRAFNRDIVKNLNLLSGGFTIETEMTIKALEGGYRIKEIPIKYRARPKGSHSKLKSFEDGKYILQTVLQLFRDHRPMQFFLAWATLMWAIAIGFTIPIFSDIITGEVRNLTNLIMMVFFIILGLQMFMAGFLASSTKRHTEEMMHLLRKVR